MLLFLLLSFTTKIANAQEVIMWAKDPLSVAPLFKGNKHIKMDDGQSFAKDNADSGYLAPIKRDAVFERTGFSKIVSRMDEADKDLLVMSVHTSDMNDLKQFYPKIKPEDLQRLKIAVDAEVGK